MSLLDDLCRLCAHKLDRSVSRNIFVPEQRNLLSIILRCIPVSVESGDRYPKYVCIHCVFKLEILFEMSEQSTSSVKIFNEIIAAEEREPPKTGENQLPLIKQEKSLEYELHDEPENKFSVEELVPADCEQSHGNDSEREHCFENFNSNEHRVKQSAIDLKSGDDIGSSNEKTKLKISRYVCETCCSTFSRKTVLKRHIRKHALEQRTQNNPSGKSTSNGGKVSHAEKMLYNCEICNKGFSRLYHYNRHMLIHTGEKPHKCQDCEKSFGAQSSLVRHNRTHRGETPYHCKECGKSFSDRSNFIQHQVIHSGKKPFSCQFCGKSFTHQSTLIGHIRTHTGEKPFKCEDCGKCFSKISSRNRHKRTHVGKSRSSAKPVLRIYR